ncbi:STM4504/CBY_0614 family protein [uncultured Citrobacter sp.]|uniref:STM4504/CBY_0614 family protein n=1 Tax=uncultured Citrobacter sp. TaxID=200446 RepID=UPI0025914EB6|nr:hypothetical protein [uncultured Citrobacter sp.]
MAIYDIFSKRQKIIKGEVSDVYVYDEIPQKLKVQFLQIIDKTIGECSSHFEMGSYAYRRNIADDLYKQTCEILRSEYGVFNLSHSTKSFKDEISNFLINEKLADKCLDVFELLSNCIIYAGEDKSGEFRFDAEEAVRDLNIRFQENGIGYQFENGEIIRVDSQFIHSEVVKPTLILLSSCNEYAGAINEFLSAHEHYRHGNYKECLNDCLKSFESLMKAIHDKHGWIYNKNDTASKLINSCLSNGLIPTYLQSQFTSLKTMLETGIPTIRNKNSGHGQGTEVITVPQSLVSYMLHLTATNLMFLSQSEQSLE